MTLKLKDYTDDDYKLAQTIFDKRACASEKQLYYAIQVLDHFARIDYPPRRDRLIEMSDVLNAEMVIKRWGSVNDA